MPTTLITGNNHYEAEAKLSELIEAYTDQQPMESLHRIDASESLIEDVLTLLDSQSLFSPGRQMVVVRGLSENKEIAEAIASKIDDLPSDTELVLFDPRLDKRRKLYKTAKKAGQLLEFSDLSEDQLILWVEKYARQHGGSITKSVARDLCRRLGANQLSLASAIIKLISYKPEISQQSVELLVEDTPEDNIFDLLDLVVNGDKREATRKYRELRRAQVDPFYILSMICWQLNNMAIVKLAGTRNDHEIASKAKMSPFVVRKIRNTVRRTELNKIKNMIKATLSTEYSLKSVSADSDQIMEQLIAKL